MENWKRSGVRRRPLRAAQGGSGGKASASSALRCAVLEILLNRLGPGDHARLARRLVAVIEGAAPVALIIWGNRPMEMPAVISEIQDKENRVKYRVLAYRKLERAELIQAVALYLRQQRKKPKRGTLVTIVTTIGSSG
jgi:hypothetical protein